MPLSSKISTYEDSSLPNSFHSSSFLSKMASNFPPGLPVGQGIIAYLIFKFCKLEIISLVFLSVSNPI